MKNKQDFKIRLAFNEDTVVMSYSQEEMEKLNPEVSADLLYILAEKNMSSDKFFEYEPASYANGMLSTTKQDKFQNSHNDVFNAFRLSVLKSMKYNANNDENDYCEILNCLYEYEKVISKVKLIDSTIQYRVDKETLEVHFKDLSILKDLEPLTAMSFPAYVSEFLDKKFAKENNTPIKKMFKVSSESKVYVHDHFIENVNKQPKKAFNKLEFYLQSSFTDTSRSVNDIFNCLKIVDAINTELNKEFKLVNEQSTGKKMKL